jgi:hypothetical protein
VSGAGRLRTSGTNLISSSVVTSRAATYHVVVRLSARAVRTLRRTHRLKVTVDVRFTPRVGTPRSVRIPMTFSISSTKKDR